MAKKVTGYIKLQIPAGKATPAPHFYHCSLLICSYLCTV